jgi:hypothetical protein
VSDLSCGGSGEAVAHEVEIEGLDAAELGGGDVAEWALSGEDGGAVDERPDGVFDADASLWVQGAGFDKFVEGVAQ